MDSLSLNVSALPSRINRRKLLILLAVLSILSFIAGLCNRTRLLNVDTTKNMMPFFSETTAIGPGAPNTPTVLPADPLNATIETCSNCINVVMIFRYGINKPDLQDKLAVAVDSLLQYASSRLALYVVADLGSFEKAQELAQRSQYYSPSALKMLHVSVDATPLLSSEHQMAVNLLQEYFTDQRSRSYYRDPLFFFSLFLYDLLPGLRRVVLLDIDIRLEDDIAELYKIFSSFQPHHVIAIGHELSPGYRHALSVYRQKHPTTHLGGSPSEGGFPGYNSGVMLVDIERLKESTVISSYMERSVLAERSNHYSFRGTLGDQDLYTLIAFDHPELFYTLPCTWNRQLCQWWRAKGYMAVFDDYFSCSGRVKLFHGNCKSKLPEVRHKLKRT